ncbi:epsin-1-like isoform X4 [Takifugu rubripes]|uniref:epsin-1-like isoform X4 n=1 Tax=Takifugu rubripes TaxID=31033 RepID=UPI001145B161|nr:epsin-1-like isoform X4 [Takifugu rubripes]
MTPSMLRRQLKNLVQNYSEAEVKVREATSNDPWGPSSSQMADISDLTYNVVACNEIMTMLWKRLKDDRNWRHIHKSLTLLEYLLKTGDDRVLLKMKDNIYIVKALTEYRFVEKDGKDQGGNVRDKAKVVLVLMEDDEKLKEERAFAVKTREKTSKSSGAASEDTIKDLTYRPCYVAGATGLPSLDNIPSVADLTASFAARKEERLKQEAEKKEVERRANLSEDELKWEDAGKANDAKGGTWGAEEEVELDAWGVPVKAEEAAGPSGPADTSAEAAAGGPSGSKSDDDSFESPKTEEPFVTPKNAEDAFMAPADQQDPFSKTKDDPFNVPKDSSDAFSAPSKTEDPFNRPKDDPFNAPKDDPFNAPKDDPFNAPKDDPFNAPKDDPFNAPKDDQFKNPLEDPLIEPSPASPKDPFAAPTSAKDPFIEASPLKEEAAPKDDTLDPFNAPPLTSPQDSSDAWGAPTSSPPATGSDPWGDGATISSPVESTLGFGDGSKPDSDPWGSSAAVPVNTGDAWGSPAPPADSSASSDPFGDGSKKDDPWGSLSSTANDETGNTF